VGTLVGSIDGLHDGFTFGTSEIATTLGILLGLRVGRLLVGLLESFCVGIRLGTWEESSNVGSYEEDSMDDVMLGSILGSILGSAVFKVLDGIALTITVERFPSYRILY